MHEGDGIALADMLDEGNGITYRQFITAGAALSVTVLSGDSGMGWLP